MLYISQVSLSHYKSLCLLKVWQELLCKCDKSSNMLGKLILYLVLFIVSASTGDAEDTKTKRRKLSCKPYYA